MLCWYISIVVSVAFLSSIVKSRGSPKEWDYSSHTAFKVCAILSPSLSEGLLKRLAATLQFWRNTDDADVIRFLKLFTELPLDEIRNMEKLAGAEINKAKVSADDGCRRYMVDVARS